MHAFIHSLWPRSYYGQQGLFFSAALVALLLVFSALVLLEVERVGEADADNGAAVVADLLARVDTRGGERDERLSAALTAALRSTSVEAAWIVEAGKVIAFAERRDHVIRVVAGEQARTAAVPAEAHNMKYSWSLFARDGEAPLAGRLEAAAKASNAAEVGRLLQGMLETQTAIAQDLRQWLAAYESKRG